MILEFSFSNFGPVGDTVTLSFEATRDETLSDYYVSKQSDDVRILKLGIIYGPNASGKTTILEALNLMRKLVVSPKDQKNDKIRYNKHLLGEKYKNNPTRFDLTFYADDVKHKYSIAFDESEILEEELIYYPNRRPAEVYSRSNTEDVSKLSFGSTIELSKKETIILEGNTLKNNTVLGSYSKSNVSNKVFDNIFGWFSNQLKPMIDPDTSIFQWTSSNIENEKIQKEKVIEFLKRADLNISDLEIIEEEHALDERMLKIIDLIPASDEVKSDLKNRDNIITKDIIFKHEFKDEDGKVRKMELETEFESNGTMRYYELAGPVLSAIENDQFLFIDELDTSLHPDLMKHLVLSFLANSKRAQMIFTTHNTSFLMERDIFRNDVVWFTEKDSNGATELFSVSDFSSKEIRKKSSIFNAYRLGKLGAKPNTSGVFIN